MRERGGMKKIMIIFLNKNFKTLKNTPDLECHKKNSRIRDKILWGILKTPPNTSLKTHKQLLLFFNT